MGIEATVGQQRDEGGSQFMEMNAGYIDVIVGLQRGDEGKGRFVDMWMGDYDIGARYGGGPNAGHTVVAPTGQVYKLHTIPSGITYPNKKCVIGDGVFVDAVKLDTEMDTLRAGGVDISPENLLISSSAHLILPHHIALDIKRESGKDKHGSTKSGIAQVDGDFGLRTGVRVEMINNKPDDLADIIYEGLIKSGAVWKQVMSRLGIDLRKEKDAAKQYVERAVKLGEYVTDTMLFLNNSLDESKHILAEGAQAFLLDKYQGMWPYVTSSITTSGGVSPGLGVPPQSINKVLGVTKAVQSHVGGGHFVTEIDMLIILKRLHGDMTAQDAERGTVTNRTRRLGWLDIPQIRRANKANGTTEMAITKLDWLSRLWGSIPICVEYRRKGKSLPIAPNAEYKLKESTPRYEYLAGWEDNISDVTRFEDLPDNAQKYIEFVEAQTKVPITHIGVGPRRGQVIVR